MKKLETHKKEITQKLANRANLEVLHKYSAHQSTSFVAVVYAVLTTMHARMVSVLRGTFYGRVMPKHLFWTKTTQFQLCSI